jgi:prepilin-type N-terminal cleavage/methylation domain-containing protein
MKTLLGHKKAGGGHHLTSDLRPLASGRGGFTLIEMLVVVIIIAILAGMILGLLKISGSWVAKSQTNERLGKVRAAIEEFYAEYGEYPPVPAYDGTQPFGYEYPLSNGLNSAANSTPCANNASWDTCPIFTFGLMSFLVQRYGDEWGRGGNYHAAGVLGTLGWSEVFNMNQWTTYNASGSSDQQRDINAIKRWKTHIQDVQELDPKSRYYVDPSHGYTNALLTVKDGWGSELNYASPPPYQSYKLWSNGPDGIPGTADDISTGPGY